MLRALYPNGNFPSETADLYASLIGDLDRQAVIRAIRRRVLSDPSGFMPTIGEIRQAVAADRVQLPDPEMAWGIVLAEIRRTGYSGTPAFADTAIADAVKIMGWADLCSSDNQVADRAHFLRIYGAVRDRAIQAANLAGRPDLALPALQQRRTPNARDGHVQALRTPVASPATKEPEPIVLQPGMQPGSPESALAREEPEVNQTPHDGGDDSRTGCGDRVASSRVGRVLGPRADGISGPGCGGRADTANDRSSYRPAESERRLVVDEERTRQGEAGPLRGRGERWHDSIRATVANVSRALNATRGNEAATKPEPDPPRAATGQQSTNSGKSWADPGGPLPADVVDQANARAKAVSGTDGAP